MADTPFELHFDIQTIKHLGVRMYSTLPPALAEIISNSYDADATNVTIHLSEQDGAPSQISVVDDGIGLSFDEVNDKFLVIGRDRRSEDGDSRSDRHKRLRTGKKGLGKLALFGLAKTIRVTTIQSGKLNEFILDWDDLLSSQRSYHPKASRIEENTDDPDGTTITLTGLKRKSQFDADSLANSLSRIFIFDSTFRLTINTAAGDRIAVTNERKYQALQQEFEWNLTSTTLVPENSEYHGQLTGKLFTSEKPIAPSTGLRGITLFSRGKLVNAPEFFSTSTSSHFYQYLTGWISVDFIDLLEEDVISTNRQSLDWGHPEMARLREFLAGIVTQIRLDWRNRRKEKKDKDLKEATGIDTQAWMNTLPGDIKGDAQQIISILGGEDALEKFTPVIKALHSIIPEYPKLHWRHLHPRIKDRVESYYVNQQYGIAASQGVLIYLETIQELTGRPSDGRELVDNVFNVSHTNTQATLQLNAMSSESEKNVQEGQGHLSRGIVTGFRNPISHAPIDTTIPTLFSELDCLNILSLASYLTYRLDNATVNPLPRT